MTITVAIDGKQAKQVKVTRDNLFTFDNKVVLEGEAVTSGEHTVTFTRDGKGPLYFNAYLTNFTLEDPITRAGLEIKVQRKYYRLNRVDATVEVAGSRGQVIDQDAGAVGKVPGPPKHVVEEVRFQAAEQL